jgi:hypothetical protein
MLRYAYIAYLVFSFCLNLVIIVIMATAITMTTSVAICSTSRCVVVAVVVSILLHTQEVIVCNSDRKPVKPDWRFVRFSHTFSKCEYSPLQCAATARFHFPTRSQCQTVPPVKRLPLPFTFLPIHYLLSFIRLLSCNLSLEWVLKRGRKLISIAITNE